MIVSLEKKPTSMKCEDHRTISIISPALKIKLLKKRSESRIKDAIGQEKLALE